MERQVIEAEPRSETGTNVMRRLRQAGRLPAVLYGAGRETLPLSLNPRDLRALLRFGGQNEIFELRVRGGESTPAMIVETQREPVKGTLLHIDLQRIAMDRKLRVSVPVVLTGEAPGVKQQGGILELVLRELEVECFPADIPARATIDVGSLLLGQSVRLQELQQQLGEKVKLLQDAHAVICHVVALKVVEEKPVEEVAAAAPAEPEVIKKGKAAEEEEAAEGGKEKAGKEKAGKEKE